MKLIASTFSNDTWWMANVGMTIIVNTGKCKHFETQAKQLCIFQIICCRVVDSMRTMACCLPQSYISISHSNPKEEQWNHTTYIIGFSMIPFSFVFASFNRCFHFGFAMTSSWYLPAFKASIEVLRQHPSPFAGAWSLFWGLATQCLQKKMWTGSLKYMYFSLE